MQLCKAGSKQADDQVQLVHGRIWEQSIKQSLKRILSLFNELLVCHLHHTLSHQSTVIFPPINSQIPANNVFILEHKGGGKIRKCSPILQEPRGGDNKTERRANKGVFSLLVIDMENFRVSHRMFYGMSEKIFRY
jgi:hypothetical protein